MDKIELNNGVSIKCQVLNKQEFAEMLQDEKGELLEKYKHPFGLEVYELQNTHVIVKENNYFTLFLSISDLDKVLTASTGIGSGQEILLNKNPFGKTFPDHVSRLVGDVLTDLNLPSNLPVDEKLLVWVDSEILKKEDAVEFKKNYFINLIAIVGEALKHNHKANWKMELSSDGQTWNPCLIIKGRKVQFFIYLYEDVFLTEKRNEPVLIETYETINDVLQA